MTAGPYDLIADGADGLKEHAGPTLLFRPGQAELGGQWSGINTQS